MNKYTLSIGDECNDGHGQKDYVTIITNLTREQLKQAYDRSVKLTGVHFEEEVASEYEDNSIPEDAVASFKTFPGYAEIFEEFESTDEVMCSSRDFAVLWKWFVKLSMEKTDTLEIIDDPENIHIGGYGMFA